MDIGFPAGHRGGGPRVSPNRCSSLVCLIPQVPLLVCPHMLMGPTTAIRLD